jgi:hypothetical protein
MTKLLGANWSTTVSGVIFTLAIAIAADPKLISFLPDEWEGTVTGICGLIAVVAGGTFAYQVKSKNVTGGTVQQTSTGAVASIGSQEQSSSVIETRQARQKT